MRDVLISKTAVKIKGNDYTILMRAPLWKVTLYHEKNKTYFESDADKWVTPMGEAFRALAKIRFENTKLVELDKRPFLTLTCRRYGLVSERDPLSKMGQRGRYKQSIVNDARYFVCETLGTSPQVETLLCKMYGVPKMNGVPIAFLNKNEVGRDESILTTVSARNTTVAATEFALPKGFRLAKSNKEVILDTNKMDMIQNLVDGLDSNLNRK